MHANKTDPNSDYKKRLSHRRMLNSKNVLYIFLWSVIRSSFSLSSFTNPIALVSPYPWIACVNTPHAKYFSYDIHFRCHCWCCGCCCRLLFLNSVCFNLYVFAFFLSFFLSWMNSSLLRLVFRLLSRFILTLPFNSSWCVCVCILWIILSSETHVNVMWHNEQVELRSKRTDWIVWVWCILCMRPGYIF